jgi:type I restriction enzyme S subunit
MRSGILRKYLPVGITLKPMAINQDLKAIQPNTEVAAEFLLHALTYWGERILATCLKAGTTVESLEFRWLKAFTIELPPVSEQVVIAGVLSDMDSEITALESRLTKARDLKQGMAQALLSGRIRLVGPAA